MKIISFSLIYLTTLFSCKDKIKSPTQNKELKTIDSSLYINIASLTPYLDTNDYSKSMAKYMGNYDTSKVGILEYMIDTFSVNKDKFRFIYKKEDQEIDATLEKLINGKWLRKIEFDKFYGSGEINHSIDVNNDGFMDILQKSRFSQIIYLYNPSISNFIDTSCGNLNNAVFLIDTLRNIYCDFQEYRQHCSTIFSSLYTFKNFKKYYLFKLDLDNCNDGDNSKIEKVTLSKCLNGNLYQTEELKTSRLERPLNLDKENYFDNKQFWKKEYKRLLGYN